MLRRIREIRVQQRDVVSPLQSNSAISAVPIRLDLDTGGRLR